LGGYLLESLGRGEDEDRVSDWEAIVAVNGKLAEYAGCILAANREIGQSK
jgi:hypothetical protein